MMHCLANVRGVPHPIPYQGSKRWIAKSILSCIPDGTRRLLEPFAGSAAVSLAAAYYSKVDSFYLNDINTPLIDLWAEIIDRPEALSGMYERLWHQQVGREREFYDQIRARFNEKHEPHCLLYLLARCVKAAIRYNTKGEFNNSPDNRRKGSLPQTMRANIGAASDLLRGRSQLARQDYKAILKLAEPSDVVYMDPPYQGVCGSRDQRYLKAVPFDEFVHNLAELNRRGIPHIVSYDGRCGSKTYGQPLPASLEATHIEVDAGTSSQGTLLGRNERTIESLYLSPEIMKRIGRIPHSLGPRPAQQELGFGGES